MNAAGPSLFRRRLIVPFLLLTLTSCDKPAPPASGSSGPAPEKPRSESDLARTTLSDKDAKSLQMRSQPLTRTEVQQRLSLPGWIVVKQGNEVTLTAPVAGYVRAVENGDGSRKNYKEPLAAGVSITRGHKLFLIQPVLTPLEQIQLASLQRSVRNELNKAMASVLAARNEVNRIRGLKEQGLRGQQDLEQANARLKHAEEDEAAARFKLTLFNEGEQGGPAHAQPLTITAPHDATVLNVAVNPGQYVSASAPLITLADLSELWVRVPVPEADLPRVAQGQAATVVVAPPQSGPAKDLPPPLELPFLYLVPQVDRSRHTADLVYRLPAEGKKRGLMAKDQLVTVDVPLGERRKETLVPYDAVVFDAHAGAWVYLEVTPPESKTHVYERRRVELGPTIGKDVVLRRLEWKDGDRIVVHDVASLFGREFYKPPIKPSK
jgi:RND family efflux transporter MFP subunit